LEVSNVSYDGGTSYGTQWDALTIGGNYYSPSAASSNVAYSPLTTFQQTEALNQITGYEALQGVYTQPAPAPAPTTGVNPMAYYGGYYGQGYGAGGYTPPSQYVQAPTITPYTGPINYATPALPSYGTPQTYVNPNPPEQVTVTGYNPQQQYVTAPDIGMPNISPTDINAGIPQIPNYGPYGQSPYGNYGMPGSKSGGGPSGGGSSGGQAPQQQQKQSPPVQVNITVPQRSRSGYSGGNTGALYNQNAQGGYGSNAGSYGTGGAGYNAPSIVPYLLLGGLGILAYNMLGKKHHGEH
jgi:hypothetical protein